MAPPVLTQLACGGGLARARAREAAAALALALLGCSEAPPAAGTTVASAIPTATAATGPPKASRPACAPACLGIERCDAASRRCLPSCPAGEIYVPATGPAGFTMGAGLKHDDVPHKVVLTRPYCLDATEVTAGAYKECVDAGKCEPPRLWGRWSTYPNEPEHPVNKVSWRHALAYCEFRGKTLPTEAQWEWAATGGDGRKWAWGNEPPDCARTDFTAGPLPSPGGDAGCHGGGPSKVGSHPSGAKLWPAGAIHDLSGNVWEWCLDQYAPYPEAEQTDPLVREPNHLVYVIRGGGWNRSARGILVHYRAGAAVGYQVPGLGFRCARNAGG
ncbi:MAG: SUMF1/EgtB/PvdO family nonheme iron enzyme [Deltaproteobacteria bacterium]|nr:SUMF1/EgtB/PvdO family nonheme iron enzyme [Deltaproteobacteria bacterium]